VNNRRGAKVSAKETASEKKKKTSFSYNVMASEVVLPSAIVMEFIGIL
jgi:hypothetical protein